MAGKTVKEEVSTLTQPGVGAPIPAPVYKPLDATSRGLPPIANLPEVLSNVGTWYGDKKARATRDKKIIEGNRSGYAQTPTFPNREPMDPGQSRASLNPIAKSKQDSQYDVPSMAIPAGYDPNDPKNYPLPERGPMAPPEETANIVPSRAKKTETEQPVSVLPSGVNLDAAGGKNFQPYIAPESRTAADLAPTFGKAPAAQPRTLISTTPRDMKKAIPDEHTITEIKNNQSYDTLGQELARNPGDIDGGNVSQMKVTGAELTPQEQADRDALNARRDANSAALDSYNETLSQANILEGAHGSQAGRRALSNIAAQQRKAHENQLKELEVKYGINLKERELVQQAPKVAAETKQLLANADHLERQSKSLTGKNATEAKFILDRAKALDKLIAATDDPVEQEKYRSLIESMGQRIVELDSTANAAPAAPAAPKTMNDNEQSVIKNKIASNPESKPAIEASLKARGYDQETIKKITGA